MSLLRPSVPWSLLALLLAAAPAAGQLSPPPGVLTLPKPGVNAQQPAAPPKAAPVAPVQQVTPFASPLLHPSPKTATSAPAAKPHPGAKKIPPVVQAPPNAHAQRPTAAAKPPDAKSVVAKPIETKPAEPKPAEASGAEGKGSVTGLALPRWVALRSDEVNLRVGPGTRFPIQWQYHRRDLPVQILREVEVWRLIQDQDGVKGWVHQATLVGHRGFVVQGKEAVLRRSASNDASPVALLKPGVVGRLRSCEAAALWCEILVGDYRGWLRRDQIWGIDPSEAVGG
jgi:SH3-like domain-containing protein